MGKNIKSFSEKISTGIKSGRSVYPRSSFFHNYQEVEIEMGSKDFQKLLQSIRKWKKEGGTLKARLKGKKESIKMKAKIEKMPPEKNGPFFYYTKSQKAKFKRQGFSIRDISAVEQLGKQNPKTGYKRHTSLKDWVEGGDAWHMITTWGFVDIGRGGFIHDVFPLFAEKSMDKSLIRFYQAGMNYHSAVGYY